MNPSFNLCNNCPKMSMKCRVSYAQVEQCEQEFRQGLAQQGKYEVIVSYYGKVAHVGVHKQASLRSLIQAQATWTHQYGSQFEIVVLNRGLHIPNANAHYICERGRVVRQYEHNAELEMV